MLLEAIDLDGVVHHMEVKLLNVWNMETHKNNTINIKTSGRTAVTNTVDDQTNQLMDKCT